ncbi:protein distal antenna-related [Drosophila rhopaloa]|uniref:Protein distal antenna-related n=1 Tax=Drosophila rhopaloa TaxID=1041015 RepID=A0A6P4EQW6_DRORH|nr:protein distal antenna-related [Drosophila rhopaloa]
MDISAYQHMNIRMSTRGKRPLRNLTPNDKVRAIQRIHNGETKASVSRDIGVPESTLRGWCKNEQKLRFMCRQLGPDHLGLDTPPEKRAKFELQLQLPPKFVALPPNYEELGFGALPYSPADYPVQGDSLLEKLSLVEFVKKNGGLHPEAMHPSQSGVVDYSNNMLHQLNLLALLNSKLTPQNAEVLPVDAPKSEDNKAVDSPAASEDYSKNTYPLLSVKNWAKDPAKRVTLPNQSEQVNDKNNNALEANGSGHQVLATEQAKSSMFPDTTIPLLPAPFPNPADLAPVIAPVGNGTGNSTPTGTDSQGAALLDWCKLFNASLNFLAFAAAAASMQPGGGGSAPNYNPNQLATGGSEPDLETYPFNEGLLKRLSPLAHSEASNESYCDSEPEDLSVRSCASKASSRSHTPDKSVGSSDAEQ